MSLWHDLTPVQKIAMAIFVFLYVGGGIVTPIVLMVMS